MVWLVVGVVGVVMVRWWVEECWDWVKEVIHTSSKVVRSRVQSKVEGSTFNQYFQVVCERSTTNSTNFFSLLPLGLFLSLSQHFIYHHHKKLQRIKLVPVMSIAWTSQPWLARLFSHPRRANFNPIYSKIFQSAGATNRRRNYLGTRVPLPI